MHRTRILVYGTYGASLVNSKDVWFKHFSCYSSYFEYEGIRRAVSFTAFSTNMLFFKKKLRNNYGKLTILLILIRSRHSL